jgi:esterase
MHPERVSGFISLDTGPMASPVEARKGTESMLDKLMSLDIDGNTRKGAMDAVSEIFPDKGFSNYITNNLVWEGENSEEKVAWSCNLKAIRDNLPILSSYDIPDYVPPYEGPCFFLNGTLSIKLDESACKKYFPNCELIPIEGAGHYVHQDKGKTTLQHIDRILRQIDA